MNNVCSTTYMVQVTQWHKKYICVENIQYSTYPDRQAGDCSAIRGQWLRVDADVQWILSQRVLSLQFDQFYQVWPISSAFKICSFTQPAVCRHLLGKYCNYIWQIIFLIFFRLPTAFMIVGDYGVWGFALGWGKALRPIRMTVVGNSLTNIITMRGVCH